MILRKLYLKIRLFLNSIKEPLNRMAVILMITTLFYVFLNSFFFKELILGKANADKGDHKCNSAITFYNAAYSYYKLNHFSQTNKEIYFELPYKIATCYLENNDQKKADESMLNGLNAIQKQYGVFSKENADFIRKYLIDYLLTNNNTYLAGREFNDLITIYKKIGYNNIIIADLSCLNGDLYYQQKNYEQALVSYQEAYNIIIKQENIDYEILWKSVSRIGEYDTKNNNIDKAIELYKNSIPTLENAGDKYSYLAADMLIKLGDLYAKNETSPKKAIKCYEQAISIIKSLTKRNYLRQNIKTYLTNLKNLYNQDGQFHKVDEIEVELARQRRFSFLF